MRTAVLLVLAACSSEAPLAFEVFGPVEDQFQAGSTIGIWTLPDRTVKFGDGQASPFEFEIGFRLDPPLPGTLDDSGIGVAMVGMLPGRATINEGEIDPSVPQLIGLSTDSAIIYKSPGALGPTWTQAFPDGYSCGVCDSTELPDTYVPADCTFVTIERVVAEPCTWF